MKPFDISSSKGNRAATRVRREKLASDKEVENNKALAMSISSVGQNWYYWTPTHNHAHTSVRVWVCVCMCVHLCLCVCVCVWCASVCVCVCVWCEGVCVCLCVCVCVMWGGVCACVCQHEHTISICTCKGAQNKLLCMIGSMLHTCRYTHRPSFPPPPQPEGLGTRLKSGLNNTETQHTGKSMLCPLYSEFQSTWERSRLLDM